MNSETNQVELVGVLDKPFIFHYSYMGKNYYRGILKVKRLSTACDYIPVVVPFHLLTKKYDRNRLLKIRGEFRSYNRHDVFGRHVDLYVFVKEIAPCKKESDARDRTKNQIILDGYICRKPRIKGYENEQRRGHITELCIAVQRGTTRSDYIPCICWNRKARYVVHLGVGERIQVEGRIQSREYMKQKDDQTVEKRVAYEVSVCHIDRVGESNLIR